MSKKQALTALVKVAKLQEKLLKKLAQKRTAKCSDCGEQMDLDDPKNSIASKSLKAGYSEVMCGDCHDISAKKWLDEFASDKEHEFDSSWNLPSDTHKCESCGERTTFRDAKDGKIVCDNCEHKNYWSKLMGF
jgi:formylmethanofuran dehydrogenase subunit E